MIDHGEAHFCNLARVYAFDHGIEQRRIAPPATWNSVAACTTLGEGFEPLCTPTASA